MAPFDAKYTQEQRDAIGRVQLDEGVTAKRAAEMAQEGLLKDDLGRPLGPFLVKLNTANGYKQELRRRRLGRSRKPRNIEELSHRDAIEALRVKLIRGADQMVDAELKKQPGNRDPARWKELVRIAREAAAIPSKTDPTPRKPGSKEGGPRTEGETRSGMAGAILADHTRAKTGTEPAQDQALYAETQHTQPPAAVPQPQEMEAQSEGDGEAGSLAMRLAAASSS